MGGRDTVIFLVDCSRSMFDDFEDGQTFFHHCVKAAHSTLTNKIITSMKDLVGIVFYSSVCTRNFLHIAARFCDTFCKLTQKNTVVPCALMSTLRTNQNLAKEQERR